MEQYQMAQNLISPHISLISLFHFFFFVIEKTVLFYPKTMDFSMDYIKEG